MDFDPSEHFPRVVRNLSEQFGITHVPGGMLLPGSDLPLPAMSEVIGLHGSPDVLLDSLIPDEQGGLTDLTAGSGSYGIFGGQPNSGSVMSFNNWVNEDDMDQALALGVPDHELEAWRDSENYGRDDIAPGGDRYNGPSVAEALADIPLQIERQGQVHPWIASYNRGRVKHMAEQTEGGRYLIGADHGSQQRFHLDPRTGEPVRQIGY